MTLVKGVIGAIVGCFLFLLLVGLLEHWQILDPILDFLGIPK